MFGIVVGVTVLLGWTLDLDNVKRVVPGLVAMNPATAISFLGLSVALWLRQSPSVTNRVRRIANIAASIVLVIGLTRVAAYIAGVDVGFDQLLFPNAIEADSSGIPNRMAPNTATLFVVLGLAMLVIDWTTKRNWRLAEWLAIAAILLSMIATLGYLYGVGALYQVDFFIPMAVNTAVTFFVLGHGVLMARPKKGLCSILTEQAAGGIMGRRMIFGAITIAVLFSFLRLEGQYAGLFGTEFGVALMTSLMITIMSGYIWWNARALNRFDHTQRAADQKMRAAHKELTEQHEVLQTILECAGEGIAVSDLEERFIVFNSAAKRLTGQAGEYQGRREWVEHFGVFKPDGKTPFPPNELGLARSLKGESTDAQEMLVRNENIPDGRFLSVSARPLKSSGGDLRGGVVVFHDITKRKEDEARLRAFNAELERCVDERTEELARTVSQLQQFAYVASHDLQEPLRMVTSYLELIDRRYRDQLDDRGREFIAYAVDGATRMKQLIVDLLDYSRAGSRGLKFEHVDGNAVMHEVVNLLKTQIEEANAEVSHDELPTIVASTGQFRQLLQNLIGNAIKFHGEEKPRVHIACSKSDMGWEFVVKDNGIGISTEHRERIFEMFQRLHSRDAYPGTGIGLAICKKIVERHHGRIWVTSEPGAGAAFHFVIPALEVSNDVRTAAA